jgi:dienelactone hydrolase
LSGKPVEGRRASGPADREERLIPVCEDDLNASLRSSAVLIVGELGERAARAASERLEREGYRVLAPELRLSGADALGDRAALAELERAAAALAARADVASERIAVLGFGRGGTLAFLLGCTSRRIAAVVDVGGPLVYPELSSARPIQPLELALNLDRPLLLVSASRDPAFPPRDVELCRESLSSAGKHFDIFALEAEPGFLDEESARFDERAAGEAWRRILDFLHEALE